MSKAIDGKISILVLSIVMVFQFSVLGQKTNSSQVSAYLDQVNGLTADDVVRYAIRHNDQLLALQKDAEASEKLINQANQRERMSVSAKGLQEVFGESHRNTVQGTMPLELGGRRKARTLVAAREAEIKRKAVEQGEAIIAAEVRRKFGESLAKIGKFKLIE